MRGYKYRYIPQKHYKERREIVVTLKGGPLDGRKKRVDMYQNWYISPGRLWYSNSNDGTYAFELEATEYDAEATRAEKLGIEI